MEWNILDINPWRKFLKNNQLYIQFFGYIIAIVQQLQKSKDL